MSAKERVLRRLRRYSGTDWVAGKVGALEAQVTAIEGVVGEHERQLRIRTVMDWVALATVPEDALISVVMPTRDRASLVARAYESVAAQTYRNWELVVVDDASVDDTRAVVEAIDDDRVRLHTGTACGVGAARNIGLDHSKGDYIAYLDDDNVMHPDWLKAVAWTFSQRPEVDVVYSGFVIDDPLRIDGGSAGGLPHLSFTPWDPRRAAREMVSDISAIAHRAGIGARFDETLRQMADWDLLLRMTKDKPPLALPFVACAYTTDAPDRLTFGPSYEADRNTIRVRHRR